MKRLLAAAVLCVFGTISGEASDEALFVRRIVEFHKDKESHLVKLQIQEFLREYPRSAFRDKILLILGDTFWSEQNYHDARTAFESLSNTQELDQFQEHYVDALFHLADYPRIVDIVQHIPVEKLSPILLLYCAESIRMLSQADSTLITPAKEIFISLLDTEYATEAKLSLADLHHRYGEQDDAFKYYIELAELQPSRRHEFLCKAARIKVATDPLQTLDILNNVSCSEAKHLAGQSHFLLKNYDEAYTALTGMTENSREYEAAVLLMLIVSAYHIQNDAHIYRWADQLEFSYPSNSALGEVAYVCGLAKKRQGAWQEALQYFEKAVACEHMFAQKGAALFELALMHYQLQQLAISRNRFLQFLHEYADSTFAPKASQYIVQNTLQMLANENRMELQQQLAEDIHLALNTPDAITAGEIVNYRLKLCNTLYALSQFDEAYALLNELLTDEQENANLPHIHLLLAMCAQQMDKGHKTFTEHAEKAIRLGIGRDYEHPLRLNLFTSYMHLFKEENSVQLTDKAADHLHAVMLNSKEPVKFENHLWLANYYYNKIKNSNLEYVSDPLVNPEQIAVARQAVFAFEAALSTYLDHSEITITPENLFLESEFFKLANLYGWLNQLEAQESLLKMLIEIQEKHPRWAWSLRTRTQFSLAYNLYKLGMDNQALRLYQALSEQKGIDSTLSNATKLMKLRLGFATLTDEEKNINNPTVIQLLKGLKDLQIRKNLADEPVHLEAAIDYVEIRSSLDTSEKMLENKRFLLQRAKESFTCQDDICSKDYQASRLKQADKERIYQAYMMLIDAKLTAIEARIAAAKNDTDERDLRFEVAKAIYQNILKEKFAVSKYLIDQAQSGLYSMRSENLHADSISK